jgi:hypothetical protein
MAIQLRELADTGATDGVNIRDIQDPQLAPYSCRTPEFWSCSTPKIHPLNAAGEAKRNWFAGNPKVRLNVRLK